ncbi:hypothetical protein [Candidatus Solirubrobacter pratensis]|uniref:hypothetical protein n=1 Tax=Candidatus Solirubrobacter pratensis TaxID=1298857 RepID=UPI000487E906|nr:hypothetical protein [Candidatus Solirubrobacter pratensis]
MTDEQAAQAAEHAGLQDFLSYSFADAIQDRRTRRVAQGVSLKGGPMSYESSNEPSPLTPLEEAILIASTSVTGAVMHDGPIDKPNGSKELGTMFLEVAGRAASSADNAQATSFFMINDEGVWLIQRPRGREALELFKEIPPRWEDRTEDDWLSFANAVKRKVHDERFSFPREWPYYLGWNAQHSNRPGTTCFLPVVDNTRQTINVLLILLSEPHGKVPLFLDDWSAFKPRTAMDWAAWAASKLGLVDTIPYHPIGGIKRVRGGFATPDTPAPLGSLTNMRTDYEAHFLLQNLMLTGEALRLGGWVHGAPMIPYVWRRDPAKGELGLGFREYSAKTFDSRWKRWPPVPASQPNYVGIDGVLEGLCPPYVTDMDAAVDQVLEEKFGPHGTYKDAEVFAQAYKDEATAETYMRNAGHPPKEAVDYAKEICRYLVETYGRFPAHSDAFHLPGIWVQFSHLEIEYYERFGNPAHTRRQAEGREIWRR